MQHSHTLTPTELYQLRAVADVPGLFYFPDFLPDRLVGEVQTYLHSGEMTWKPVGTGAHSRRASHTGYDYDYTSKKITRADPIPEVFQRLAYYAREACRGLRLDIEHEIDDVPEFNQCLVNEYIGQHAHGISAHIDLKTFGPFIACYTFESGTEMQFQLGDQTVDIYVRPNSLYIMSGPARWQWKHSMPCRKSDPDPDRAGKRIPRGDRYSVTFRHYTE